jgi:hypothetical protein
LQGSYRGAKAPLKREIAKKKRKNEERRATWVGEGYVCMDVHTDLHTDVWKVYPYVMR